MTVEIREDAVERVEALLEDAAARRELRSHSFVLPSHRLLYVATPKVACTSLKTMLLAALGKGLDVFADSTLLQPTRAMLVHDRALFPAPSLPSLEPEERRRALTEEGWLRFCVVRDPYARVYSAWEGKVLLPDPALYERFGPVGAGDVLDGDGRLDLRASFAAFVEDLAARPDFYRSDPHFEPQHAIVHAEAIPYDEVVRLERLAEFAPRLRAHLAAHGPDPGDPPRSNEGLGVAWRDVYDAPTAARVRELYAEDFARFGYASELACREEPVLLDDEALARVRELRAGTAVQVARARPATAEDARDAERAERERLEGELEALGWEHGRVARRLAGLVGQYEELAGHHADLVARHEELSPRYAELSNAHAALSEEHAALVARHERLAGHHAAAQGQLEALQGRWEALERRRIVRLYRRLRRLVQKGGAAG